MLAALHADGIDLGLDVGDLGQDGGVLEVGDRVEVQHSGVVGGDVSSIGGLEAGIQVVQGGLNPGLEGVQESVDLGDGELGRLAGLQAVGRVVVPLVDPENGQSCREKAE